MIIDSTYFQGGEITIPGITNNNSGPSEAIQRFIDLYEKRVLISAMGYSLYSALEAEIDSKGGDLSLLVAPWNNLVNGEDYSIEVAGETVPVRWNGLDNDEKDSFIAYYVYYHYWVENVIKTSNTGFQKPRTENTDNAETFWKLARIHNENFLDLYGQTEVDYIDNAKVYLHPARLDRYAGNKHRSIKHYIEDKNDDTPDTFANFKWRPLEPVQ